MIAVKEAGHEGWLDLCSIPTDFLLKCHHVTMYFPREGSTGYIAGGTYMGVIGVWFNVTGEYN